MTTAFELLNRIKSNSKENHSEYTLSYEEKAKNIEISLTEVVFLNQLAFTIRQGHEDVEIPMHRLRKIYKRGLLLWNKGN